MCLVIDTCCLPKVFDRANLQHSHFAPVLNWITLGNGRMIYGGTKYNRELAKASRYLGIVAELERGRRAIRIPEIEVDAIANAIRMKISDCKFNDEHLVALRIASRCCLICTDDKVAMPYLKDPDLYRPYHLKKPKIYCYREHRRLINDKHVVGVCLQVEGTD
jgi:hypothetical protein